MKTLVGVCVMGLIITVVAVEELVRSVIAAWPYLVIAVLVFGVLRARATRSASDRGPAEPRRPTTPLRPVAPPVSGWVLVPVWMGPERSPLPVIDAEVLDQRRGPT